MSSCFDFCVV